MLQKNKIDETKQQFTGESRVNVCSSEKAKISLKMGKAKKKKYIFFDLYILLMAEYCHSRCVLHRDTGEP